MPDNEQGELEERWITLGNTQAHPLRLVVHTFMTYHQDLRKDIPLMQEVTGKG
jgi:hypothetical protein